MLDNIHPRVSILRAYGTSTIVRLSLDPIAVPSGTMERTVAVNWMSRVGTGCQQTNREIGWSCVPREITDECPRWINTINAQDITEGAAIGVMALLIHDLEQAEIVNVLQIGSGGDYLLTIKGNPQLQAESSGVHIDDKGYLSTARLTQKTQQVLTKCSAGFVSITAFSHTENQQVHSYLHYVTSSNQHGPSPKKSRGGERGRGRKKRK